MSNTFKILLTPSLLIRNVFLLAIVFIFLSCNQQKTSKNKAGFVEIKDMNQRSVFIPKQINKVVAHRSGALRFICYLNAVDKVVGVEANERRRNVPYLYAYPQLRDLPLIGSGNNADPELIAALKPDVILCTYFSSSEADELQKKTGIPVICLDYGDFNENKEGFYKSLKLLGKLLDKEERSNFLINYIENFLDDIQKKCDQNKSSSSVYIGGIAFRGAHGINSTEPKYAPFRYTNCRIPALELVQNSNSKFSKLTTISIDKEEIVKWDPDYLFVDASGYKLAKTDLDKESVFGRLIPAIQEKKVYILLPHIWNTINYEHILVNSAYIASVLHPDQFKNFNIEKTANSIYKTFFDKELYDKMTALYGFGCQKLNIDE